MSLIRGKLLDEVVQRITWAQAYRRQFEAEWDEALRYYAGDQWSDTPVSVADPLVVNKFWPLVQAMIPQLFYRAPYVFVRPEQQNFTAMSPMGTPLSIDATANARSVEALGNRFWRSRRMKWDMRQIIVDTQIYSHGWFKVGYGSEFGIQAKDRAMSDLDTEMLAELRQIFPDATEDDLLRLSGKDHLLEFDAGVVQGDAWAKRVNPMHVWVDPSNTELEEMRFLVHYVERQLRTVKADPLYTGTQNLGGHTHDFAQPEKMRSKSGRYAHPDGVKAVYRAGEDEGMSEGDPVDSIGLYEYYDRERQAVYTLVNQGGGDWKCIRKTEEWPYNEIRDFPFKCLRLNVVPNRFYPFTGIHHWIEQQRELNLYRSQQADHIRRMGRKIFVEKGFFDTPEEKAKMETPGAGIIVEVQPNGISQNKWAPAEFGSVPQDLWRGEASIREDIREATVNAGSPNAMGQPNPHVTSATESSIMASSVGQITDDQLTLISDFASDVTRDLFSIYRQFWNSETMIEHTNPVEGRQWVPISPDLLQGEFVFKIEVGSTQKESHEAKQRQATQLLQIFLNPFFLQAFGPDVLKSMAVRLLRTFQIDYPDELFAGAREWIPPEVRAKMEQEMAQKMVEGISGAGGAQDGTIQPNQNGGGPVSGGPTTPGEAGATAPELQAPFGGPR